MDLLTLIILLVSCLFVVQFWRLRGVAEHTVKYANEYCDKHNLQYISLARSSTKFCAHKGKLDWQLRYEMAFSSDGETEYTGSIVCHGYHVIKVDLPVYRVDHV
ncbi:MAG: DUF3301 domain-containing protein [Glaciecola sp.]